MENDLQEVTIERDPVSHNILIPSLDSISSNIARHAEVCQIHSNTIPVCESDFLLPTVSNDFGDSKSNTYRNDNNKCVNMLRGLNLESNDDIDLEMEASHRIDIQQWFPDNYESPIHSPHLSPISQLSNSSECPFENEGDNEYDDYFNCEQKKSKYPSRNGNIFEMLKDIQYFRKQVIYNIDPKYVKKNLIYFCRAYIGQESRYKYIVGFTRDIENVLETIDDTYACEWKMEILTLTEANSQNMEIKIKYDILQRGVDIESGLYEIDWRVHKHMLELGGYINPFYMIDNNNDETYLGKKITHIDHTSEHIE